MYITESMEKNPGKAISRSASQTVLTFYKILEFKNNLHQPANVHYFEPIRWILQSNSHFNIILSPTPGVSKLFPP